MSMVVVQEIQASIENVRLSPYYARNALNYFGKTMEYAWERNWLQKQFSFSFV